MFRIGADVAACEFQTVSSPPSPPLTDLVWESMHIVDPPAVEGGADLPYGAIYLGTKEGPAGSAPLIGTRPAHRYPYPPASCPEKLCLNIFA